MSNYKEESYEAGRRKNRKKKRRNPITVFFRTAASIVLVFCIVAGGAVFAYHKLIGETANSQTSEAKPQGNTNNFIDSILGKGIKLNVAVFGVDGDGTRTDVMFVVHFDSKQKKVGLISLPRDTRVTLTNEIQTDLEKAGRYYQSPTKLNAVHAYSGKEMGCKNTVLQIEDLLGVKIDHYVKIDFEGFRSIVDAIGGVEVDVPQDMKYSDPYQDLYINLKAGVQVLDGEKAEQLVRFRRYKEGDVARVEVQQQFLKAFAEKIVNTDTLLNNLPSLISTAYNYVETDVTLVDALKYARYITDVDMNNTTMELLPGTAQYVGNVSYYLCDEEETKKVVDRVFYGIEEETPVTIETSSKDKKIEVSNGGYTQGLAGKTRDKLKKEGYQITSVTTYQEEKLDYTRIIVGTDGMGEDLKQYFDDSKIEVNESLLSPGTDIKIILGTNET